MSLKYTTFSLRESGISFLVPAWHFHMCSICRSPKPETLCLRLFTVFTCFLVALRWLLGWCRKSSLHSLQLFLLRPLSKYLFSIYAPRNTQLQSHFSKFIISNLIYHHYLFSNYLFTYQVLGVWAFSQSKLGASVAVPCGLSSCSPLGLGFSEAYGIVHGRVGLSRTRGQKHVFCIGRQTLNTGPPRKSSYHHSLPADFPGPTSLHLHTPLKISFKDSVV